MNKVISKDGTAIAYDIYGEGSVFIFITGASCFRNFMPVKADAKGFAKGFKVYNYDRRGRGDSADKGTYSIDRELEDIEALIDASGEKAILYGHSSGAVLALEAALKFPDKIKKLVIYDAAYVHAESEKPAYAELTANVKALILDGKNVKALRAFLIGIGMPKIFVYMLPLMPGWKTMVALAPTLLYDMELTKDLAPVARLSRIQVPTQIFYGEKSPASMKSTGGQIHAAISQSVLVEVKGQDHMATGKTLLPLFKAGS